MSRNPAAIREENFRLPIALEFPESAMGSLKFSSLMAAGFLLMIISFATLMCSRWLLRSARTAK